MNHGRRRNRNDIWSTGRTAHWGDSQGRRPRRCTSEPPHGSFAVAVLGGDAVDMSFDPPRNRLNLEIMYPRIPLAQLERRSRRRSLSRSRIEEMFDREFAPMNLAPLCFRPHYLDQQPPANHLPESRPQRCCQNCRRSDHEISDCPLPCGHCGAPRPQSTRHPTPTSRFFRPPSTGGPRATRFKTCEERHQNPHQAPQCPVAPHNRCKCLPFPTFHVAARCGIPCRRDCQDLSGKHRVAMLCKARCCMCGLRGHSGRECRLSRCRCGFAHLGQDCSWNPTCRVPGCDRFLCGVHCRGCGSRERPFVDWRCVRCRSAEGLPVPEEAPRGRRRKRGGDGEAETVGTVEVEVPVASEEGPSTVYPPSIFGGPRNTNWETDGFTCKAWARGRNKYRD